VQTLLRGQISQIRGKPVPPGNQKALFGTRLARRIEKTEIRKLKTENFFITLQVRTIMN
jgi:hypothetical protein